MELQVGQVLGGYTVLKRLLHINYQVVRKKSLDEDKNSSPSLIRRMDGAERDAIRVRRERQFEGLF